MELILGASSARLLEPEDLTRFAVVLEDGVAPGPEALAEGGVLGFGDHAWVRTDALRRLAQVVEAQQDGVAQPAAHAGSPSATVTGLDARRCTCPRIAPWASSTHPRVRA